MTRSPEWIRFHTPLTQCDNAAQCDSAAPFVPVAVWRRIGRKVSPCCAGVTLLELVVVLLILVVLAGLLVPQFSTLADDAHAVATRETLRQTRDAILSRYAADMRGVLVRDRDANPLTFDAVEQGAPGADDTPLLPATRALGPQLLFLFVNPHTYSTASTFDPLLGRGWRGPYVMSHGAVYPGHDPATAAARGFTSAYGEPGDATLLDAWGNPVVLIEGGTLALTEVRSAGADGILHTTDDLTLPLR